MILCLSFLLAAAIISLLALSQMILQYVEKGLGYLHFIGCQMRRQSLAAAKWRDIV